MYKRQDLYANITEPDTTARRVNEGNYCPTVIVYINNCKVQALIDTVSEISVVSKTWLRNNKQYFKLTPTLPVNELYITTANHIRERVKQQIFANITLSLIHI